MIARVLAMALCLCPSLSVCHKSVFYRNGWTDLSVLRERRLLSTSHTLRYKEIQVLYLQKGYFPLELVSFINSGLKISPRHIDRRNVLLT